MDPKIILVSLCVVLIILQDVRGQKCKAPPKLPGQSFPDILQITGGSFMFFIEANHPMNNQTYYVTEYMDTKSQRSRAEVSGYKQRMDILHFGKTNEIFDISGQSCVALDKKLMIERIKNTFGVELKDITNIGVYDLLRAAYQDWMSDGTIGVEPEYAVVRGLKSSVWTWCTNTGHTFKIYFTDPKKEHPYGLGNIPVPVRIIIDHDDGQLEHQEIFRMIPNLSSKKIEEVMQIPPMKGCVRSEDEINATSFETKNVYLEAEVIYTPLKNNGKNYTYITNMKYLRHRSSQLTAVHWTPWTSSFRKGMALSGDEMIKVFDNKNGFTYTMDRTQETCDISTNDAFSFSLPDGTNLDDINEDLLFFGDDASSYHFLGKTTERGIPAAVFEKTERDAGNSIKRVITRYYMDNDTLLEDEFQERNSPLKTVFWKGDKQSTNEKEFTGVLIINVYGFKSRFSNVHEMFDVSACFQEEDQSKWFQIVFPLGNNKLSDLMPHIPHIRNDLPSLLQSIDKDHSPLRIPRIQVDYDPRNIYATGLILERPDFLLDFTIQKNRTLKQSAEKTETSISTLNECAKSCLHNAFCQYFSYCGAVCVIATDNQLKVTDDMVTEANCTLYNNTLYNAVRSASLLTMDQLSSAIKQAIEVQNLRMVYFKRDGSPLLDLVADKLIDNIAFGRNGMQKNEDTGKADKSFTVYKPEAAFVSKASEGTRTINKVSYEVCKSVCADQPWCESVSYCMVSRECILTKKFLNDIIDEDTTTNSQCLILSRNYVSRYKKYQGTVIVKEGEETSGINSVEECAKACSKETSFPCLSFDFCKYSTMKCVMHKRYFDSGTPSERQQLGREEECNHYARKAIQDLDLIPDNEMSKNIPGLRLANVTPEECARVCKEERYVQPCVGFDHCSGLLGANSTCVLRKESKGSTKNPSKTCNSYIWKS